MPNMLFFISDEHNPKYSSIYGNCKVNTPNMEKLGAEGVTFENAYSTSPLCMPSRSSFMSGRPVHKIQAYNNCNAIERDFSTYEEVLKNQGVHTVHAGKSHVLKKSNALGFSETINPEYFKPPGDTNIRRDPLQTRKGSQERANGYGIKEDPFRDDREVVEKSINWLENQSHKLSEPWTLIVNTLAPHFPHYATEELWDMYDGKVDLPEYGANCESAKHPYAKDLRGHFETDAFTDEQILGLRRGYFGRVTYVDRVLGRLLEALKKSGQMEDTVIVYTSDHGEMLGKFGMWWKCSLYDDSIRVPLIVAGPGFPSGEKVETSVSLLDLQSTIFETLKKKPPINWWGVPLQRIIRTNGERAIFSEYHGHGVRGGAFMIRKGKWKLIYNEKAPHQLFNMDKDPEELNNLAGERSKVFSDLKQDLYDMCDPENEFKRARDFIQKQLQEIKEQ